MKNYIKKKDVKHVFKRVTAEVSERNIESYGGKKERGGRSDLKIVNV